jgi:hypothetical protein
MRETANFSTAISSVLARLKSNKIPAILIIAFLCLSCPQLGFSRDNHEGSLFDLRIREEAQKFLRTYNAANNTNWLAWNAEMADVVPECAESIQVEWEREAVVPHEKNVLVLCSKTIDNNSWTVRVPVRALGDSYSIEQAHGDDIRHGLYEIREKAWLFIAEYNKKHRTHFVSLDPDLRIVIPRCAAPLSVKWDGKENGFAEVFCKKVKAGSFGKENNWTVKVRVACDLPPAKRSNQCRL